MINGTALFIGVESQAWPLSQFHEAANKAKALGISTLIIKIADGTNVWYGELGGWQKVFDTIKSESILPIPYIYSYGDTFGGLQLEIAIIKQAMATSGIVITDMEAQWNGQDSWASTVCEDLKDAPGIFTVTTWADPEWQKWQSVMGNLKECVDIWMPQAYSDTLAGMYKKQFAGLNTIPVLNLGTDFGPNDVLQNAKDAQSQTIALWEYQSAIGDYASTVKEIVAMSKVPAGWSDDGQTLRGPNNEPVVLGFRDWILILKITGIQTTGHLDQNTETTRLRRAIQVSEVAQLKNLGCLDCAARKIEGYTSPG